MKSLDCRPRNLLMRSTYSVTGDASNPAPSRQALSSDPVLGNEVFQLQHASARKPPLIGLIIVSALASRRAGFGRRVCWQEDRAVCR